MLFSEADVEVAVAIFRPVALPFRIQFSIEILSEDVTTVAAFAIRITDVSVVVFDAVFVMVKFLLVPGVSGLSPLIVTLSAPFNSISPRPVVVEPEMVTPSADGEMMMLVYNALPAPELFKTAGAVSVVLAEILMAMSPWWVPALIASNAPLSVVYVPAGIPAVAATST